MDGSFHRGNQKELEVDEDEFLLLSSNFLCPGGLLVDTYRVAAPAKLRFRSAILEFSIGVDGGILSWKYARLCLHSSFLEFWGACWI
jgi:hypothetical protein